MSKEFPEVLNYTWASFEASLSAATRIVKPCCMDLGVECVIAIARGGLVLGTILSYRLNLPLFVIDPQRVLGFSIPHKNVLLVDDLSDTGTTFNRVIPALTDHQGMVVTSLAIHTKEGTLFEPNFVLDRQIIKPTTWVNYPWEQCNG